MTNLDAKQAETRCTCYQTVACMQCGERLQVSRESQQAREQVYTEHKESRHKRLKRDLWFQKMAS